MKRVKGGRRGFRGRWRKWVSEGGGGGGGRVRGEEEGGRVGREGR